MDPSLILGSAGVGAGVQIFKQMISDQHAVSMKALDGRIKESKANNDNHNDAAKRGSGWGRRFALVTVMTVAFFGLIFAVIMDVPVSQVVNREPIINLLNLIKIGGGQKVIQSAGLMLPEYVSQSVQIIMGFYFGSSAAKR